MPHVSLDNNPAITQSEDEYLCLTPGDPVSAEHVIADLHEVLRRLDQLEQEFGPLARRYARFAATPAAKWSRANGRRRHD